jgi:hypothetical protein
MMMRQNSPMRSNCFQSVHGSIDCPVSKLLAHPLPAPPCHPCKDWLSLLALEEVFVM